MKKEMFFALMLICCTFAEFQLQSADISIKMNEDGSAAVSEKFNLIIYGDYYYQFYQSGFNNNTLSVWQTITGINEIKAHINSQKCDIHNFVIRPQPSERSLSVSDVWYAQIILDYEAAPYYAEDGSILNSSGLFIMESNKPRTMFYTLNDAALNFFRTPT
ncbi:hypothetical protein KJ780_03155, partial [Candidatus Micrarchaeota archaeon]|nr:hypothetical protein [Candidatus Micrarchaeota archaeon]